MRAFADDREVFMELAGYSGRLMPYGSMEVLYYRIHPAVLGILSVANTLRLVIPFRRYLSISSEETEEFTIRGSLTPEGMANLDRFLGVVRGGNSGAVPAADTGKKPGEGKARAGG